ncbi:DUF2149 domain-containing protein [Pseudomonas indica]|uniref:DUF2149 domain-containing protein n=1 Tax=Pseudomonas indica TaxID=137658 RepID=A0A1G9AF34_9PSED|nr:DUF2149 domain-containing protein [Pseudomonas indica]MBU3056145.1 DUF2149 domain-containing protein [Pseudomonas indica]PAU65536.1 hypothetical protein BZL42_00155 [Pseudomonas indica]SDK25444.1 hypothetical protein SAMN05216186_105181 [Pseudomonas indica]
MSRRWRSSRFAAGDDDPLGPLANMVDVVLVFACGLIAALVAQTDLLQRLEQRNEPVAVERGRELPRLPDNLKGQGGEGLESVGQVYRDPQTGKLILIGQ